MSDLTCPYCEHSYDYEYDDPPKQDELLEIECPKCEKYFTAIASWELYFYGESKADCLNGGDHEFQSAPFIPNYYPDRKRCVNCGYTEDGKYKPQL